MPTRSWAKDSALVFALALASASSACAATARADLALPVDGRTLRVPVTLDAAAVNARDHEVRVLGVRRGFALVVDGYASRGQGLNRCQAGHERWVRLIDVARRRELWSKLAESCLKDVEPGDPIAAWSADGRSAAVNLVSEPSLRINVGPEGQVSAAPQP